MPFSLSIKSNAQEYFAGEAVEIVETACDHTCLNPTSPSLMLVVFTKNGSITAFLVVAINQAGIMAFKLSFFHDFYTSFIVPPLAIFFCFYE